MNGSLALVGSGEYLAAMAQFEKSLVDDGVKNGKKARYVQIPTAAGRESSDRLGIGKSLDLDKRKILAWRQRIFQSSHEKMLSIKNMLTQ